MIKLKFYIQKLLDDNSVFVSIGANDGIFVDEIFQSKLLNPLWRSYFIEPVKQTFDKLQNNYSKYYPDNTFIYINCAIHNYDGSGFLITHKKDDSMGMCSFFMGEHKDTIKIPVKCKTLGTILKQYKIDHIDFLKIDAEGMDYEIVHQCLENTIYPKIILLETIALGNNDLTTNYKSMINSISDYYTIIDDIPEAQYETSNLLLIHNNYV